MVVFYSLTVQCVGTMFFIVICIGILKILIFSYVPIEIVFIYIFNSIMSNEYYGICYVHNKFWPLSVAVYDMCMCMIHSVSISNKIWCKCCDKNVHYLL